MPTSTSVLRLCSQSTGTAVLSLRVSGRTICGLTRNFPAMPPAAGGIAGKAGGAANLMAGAAETAWERHMVW